MFCNNIEETLFAPLPPSLWTDYYNDRDADGGFGKGILRRNRPRSSMGTLLPAPCHFQSLPPTGNDDYFAVGGTTTSVDEAFHDEFRYATVAPSSPTSPYRSTPHPSGQAVKSLFHDGCLFAYSHPTSDRKSIRSVMKRAKGSISPRSRRRVLRINHAGMVVP